MFINYVPYFFDFAFPLFSIFLKPFTDSLISELRPFVEEYKNSIGSVGSKKELIERTISLFEMNTLVREETHKSNLKDAEKKESNLKDAEKKENDNLDQDANQIINIEEIWPYNPKTGNNVDLSNYKFQ